MILHWPTLFAGLVLADSWTDDRALYLVQAVSGIWLALSSGGGWHFLRNQKPSLWTSDFGAELVQLRREAALLAERVH